MPLSTDAKAGLIGAVIIAIATAGSAPWWWQDAFGKPSTSPAATTPAQAARIVTTPGPTGMSGGCAAFQLFGQGRWKPYGTAVRRDPSILSPQISGYVENKSITVDGWVHSRPAFPTNTAPWNSDIWYHVAEGGWVSFPGVRSTPVAEDPTGQDPDGGPPAPASPSCQGAVN